MYLLGKRADNLNDDDIRRLVQNKVQENKSLDYKRELKLSVSLKYRNGSWFVDQINLN